MDCGASSPCTLCIKLSLTWSLLRLSWLVFFVPLWFLEGPYQCDDQLNWKPLPPSFVICYLGYLAVRHVSLASLSVFVCGFFIAFLGENFISYLAVAGTIATPSHFSGPCTDLPRSTIAHTTHTHIASVWIFELFVKKKWAANSSVFGVS
ncbi:hypothetical protein EDB19DRAFT_1750464 [Suillus lakei]|nr:hypothetical protein EDB19DRAFT_1750464 [Suillus lakei]